MRLPRDSRYALDGLEGLGAEWAAELPASELLGWLVDLLDEMGESRSLLDDIFADTWAVLVSVSPAMGKRFIVAAAQTTAGVARAMLEVATVVSTCRPGGDGLAAPALASALARARAVRNLRGFANGLRHETRSRVAALSHYPVYDPQAQYYHTILERTDQCLMEHLQASALSLPEPEAQRAAL